MLQSWHLQHFLEVNKELRSNSLKHAMKECLIYEPISRLKLYLDIQSVNVHKLTYSWQVEEHSWYQEHQNRSRIIISWFETCFENLNNIPNAECSNNVVRLIPLRTIAIWSSCVINKEYHIYSWYKCKSNSLKKLEKNYASLLWLLLSNYKARIEEKDGQTRVPRSVSA